MKEIKTFSLSSHIRLFTADGNGRSYYFARSANQPYEEEPYRAESYVIGFLREGSFELQVGTTSHKIVAPALITIGPSVIRSFVKSGDQDKKMDILFFKSTFLLEKQTDLFFLEKFSYFETGERHILQLSGTLYEKVNFIFNLINMAHSSPNCNLAEIIRCHILALIYEIDAYYQQQPACGKSLTATSPLVNSFRQLLHSSYLRERKLNFYAEYLNVTVKHLSAMVKKQTGKSAGEWIIEIIILEAKVLLQNRTLSISQISDHLNFPDQSGFGKFFKAGSGYSPQAYRKKL